MAPINLPDGTEVSEIVLPDGSTASEVLAPDGSTVFGGIPDSVVTRPADRSTSGESNSRGLAISPASDFSAIGARISNNTTGVTRARVYNYSQSAYVKSVDISALSPGDAFTIDYGFDSGQDYGIELDANGSSYTIGFAGGAKDYPYTSTDVDIIAASIDGSQSTGDSAQGVNDIGNTGF